ncbi:hypothetical protein FocTR4_00002308, partial [Fusarium oxysporum f. sp. cubense]
VLLSPNSLSILRALSLKTSLILRLLPNCRLIYLCLSVVSAIYRITMAYLSNLTKSYMALT